MKSLGFTLIELLVIIAVISILVAIAMPFIQNYIQESKISKAKADLEEISKALATYEMREQPYNASDLFWLEGRYLNRTPIDPWGQPYYVATDSGYVYSCGPDRIPFTTDDIVSYYQPQLALVNAYWVDANYSAKVDSHNIPDYLILVFSRPILASSPAILNSSNAFYSFELSSTSTINLAFDWANMRLSSDAKSIILPIASGVNNFFTAGSDTITVTNTNQLFDTSRIPNRCLASQPVVIRRQ